MLERKQNMFVLIACAFALLASCVAVPTEFMYRLEVQTRQSLYRSLDSNDSEEEGEASSTEAQEGIFQLGAQEIYWLVPGKMRVVTRSVLRGDQEGQGTAERSLARRIVDFDRGLAWVSTGESSYRKTSLRIEDYEKEMRRRANRVDFLDQYLRSPVLRAVEGISYFRGRDQLVTRVEKAGLDQRQVLWCVVEPGVLWEITVREDLDVDMYYWLKHALLYSVIGLPPDRTRDLSCILGGFPVSLRAILLPTDEGQTVIDYDIVSLRKRPVEMSLFEAPPSVREDGEDSEHPSRPEEILSELESRTEQAGEAATLRLVLGLEPFMNDELLERIAALASRSIDPFLKVELMRLALRHDEQLAWPFLRESLRGSRAIDALAATEALIAEDHPRARAALVGILRSRQRYSGLPTASIVAWGVPRMRVLSGMSLEELSTSLSGIWPGIGGDDPAELHELLGKELDFWLRWAEQNGEIRDRHPLSPPKR